jgi:hypothetical protein
VKNIGHRLFSLGLIAAALCCLDTADAQTATVVASPPQLTFNTQTSVATPTQTVLLSAASGNANVAITSITADTNWLTVTPQSGTTPLVITVAIGAGAPTSTGVSAASSMLFPGRQLCPYLLPSIQIRRAHPVPFRRVPTH